MDVDRARPAREGEAPDTVEDPLAGDDDPRPFGEMPDEVELARGELDVDAVDDGRARAAVEDDVAGREPVGVGLRLGAAEHGADTCSQLARRERLRDVVVRTELEPGDAVDLLVAGRQHHDRQRRDRANRLAEVEAVGVRELEVEDRQPDVVSLELLQPLRAAGGPDDAKPLALEVRADDRGDVLLVLDEQDRAAARHRVAGAEDEHEPGRPVAGENDVERPAGT